MKVQTFRRGELYFGYSRAANADEVITFALEARNAGAAIQVGEDLLGMPFLYFQAEVTA